mmetsp:Transcript_22457/g.56156  ORF Transcript_22457/g.56156 Transcript_22457/m.56156 type:complete len:371 (+) Transcript_22457:270-1382(+)
MMATAAAEGSKLGPRGSRREARAANITQSCPDSGARSGPPEAGPETQACSRTSCCELNDFDGDGVRRSRSRSANALTGIDAMHSRSNLVPALPSLPRPSLQPPPPPLSALPPWSQLLPYLCTSNSLTKAETPCASPGFTIRLRSKASAVTAKARMKSISSTATLPATALSKLLLNCRANHGEAAGAAGAGLLAALGKPSARLASLASTATSASAVCLVMSFKTELALENNSETAPLMVFPSPPWFGPATLGVAASAPSPLRARSRRIRLLGAEGTNSGAETSPGWVAATAAAGGLSTSKAASSSKETPPPSKPPPSLPPPAASVDTAPGTKAAAPPSLPPPRSPNSSSSGSPQVSGVVAALLPPLPPKSL